jgi:hypothetical protein
MTTELRVKPTFGGHEKFVFRQSWLKKGIDALQRDPAVFTGDEALVTLGVGKNMVRSIRHWCLATNVIEETEGAGRTRSLAASRLGQGVFDDHGWDPYLEDVGTLWLLHWQLANNVHRALVWELLFSRFFEAEFTKRQLAAFVGKQLERMQVATTSGTIEREVDCLLRTYVSAARSQTGGLNEESMDCPLVELDLIRFVADDNVYRFNIGPKATLPVEVFGYALLQFLAPIVRTRRTVHVDECVYHPTSPGQVFRLDENSVVDYLESLEEQTDGAVRLQETAGLPQLYLHGYSATDLDSAGYSFLAAYYG